MPSIKHDFRSLFSLWTCKTFRRLVQEIQYLTDLIYGLNDKFSGMNPRIDHIDRPNQQKGTSKTCGFIAWILGRVADEIEDRYYCSR